MVAFAKLCNKKKWGYPIKHGDDGEILEYLPILAFCDNFWLLAKSPQELQNKSSIFFNRCKVAGWEIPLDECVWTTTATDYDERWRLVVEDKVIERRSRDDLFKALGCIISADGLMQLELQNRFSQASNAFFKHAPINKRIELLKSVVEPSLFWCAGTWLLNQSQKSNLRGLQRDMVMKMIRPRRKKDEFDDQFFPRTHRYISDVIVRTKWLTWDLRAKDYYFRWAGQVSRMAKVDHDRVTLNALRYWNIESIMKRAERNGGNQGHGRRLHVWRWETDVHQYGVYCGANWESLTGDVSEWLGSHMEKFRTLESSSNNMRVWGHKRSRIAPR